MQDEDAAVYRMIQRADTIGVFQIESRAQMSMLPRLKPKEFYDLVIEVAIVRPGPIQGDMVHPYLRRRQGLEPVRYPSPELEAILHKTLGVPLFQEHAMRIAIVAAGFEPAEADKLRRAMATFKRVGTIKYFRDKFINGMASRGYDSDFAARCFSQIEGFGEYGFPESHAASFANLVYASAWIKCRYPDVFACALLNSQPMGFYAAAQIVRDAQEHAVEVRPVDINHSDWDCGLEPGAGGALRARAPASAPRRRCATTSARPMRCGSASARSADFRKRTGSRSKACAGWVSIRCAISGCAPASAPPSSNGWRKPMRSARSASTAAMRCGRCAPCSARATRTTCRCSLAWRCRQLEPDIALPPMLLGEHVVEDYRRLHLSLKAHPVAFLRPDLARRGILRHDQLPAIASGRRVTVGGLVLVRQRPGTAAGVIFMTLEDETAIANTIVWPKIYETFRPIVLGARLISVTGKLQNESGVIHVVAERVEDLTPLLRRLSQEHGCVEALARADAVKHPAAPDPHPHRHPRAGDALVTLFKDEPALGRPARLRGRRHAEGQEFSLSRPANVAAISRRRSASGRVIQKQTGRALAPGQEDIGEQFRKSSSLDAIREPDDEVVPVRHLHLGQRGRVHLLILGDELVGRQDKGGQRIDLLIGQRTRLGPRHRAADEIEYRGGIGVVVGNDLAAVERRLRRTADHPRGKAALAFVAMTGDALLGEDLGAVGRRCRCRAGDWCRPGER